MANTYGGGWGWRGDKDREGVRNMEREEAGGGVEVKGEGLIGERRL